jgi:hypothetical protein
VRRSRPNCAKSWGVYDPAIYAVLFDTVVIVRRPLEPHLISAHLVLQARSLQRSRDFVLAGFCPTDALRLAFVQPTRKRHAWCCSDRPKIVRFTRGSPQPTGRT